MENNKWKELKEFILQCKNEADFYKKTSNGRLIESYGYQEKAEMCQTIFDKMEELNKTEISNKYKLFNEMYELLKDIVLLPVFNGNVFDKDKESHRAWTIARYLINEVDKENKKIS